MQIVPPPIVPVKNSNAPIVIIAVVVGFIFLIGILVAIAIPRFVAYRERVKNLGGLQLILDVKVDKAVENHIAQIEDDLLEQLRKKRIRYQELASEGTTGINITLLRKEDEQVFKDLVEKNYRDFELQSGLFKENGVAFQLILRDQIKTEIKKMAYEQTLKIFQNRMDALGIKRTDIHPQKDTQILIQLPGVKDPQKAIERLGQRGLLEFKLVDEENMVGDWQENVPPGSQVLSFKNVNEKGERPKILVKRRASLTGQNLKDARPNISSQNNRMSVSLSFDAVGARKFERITEENVGRQLAIVLDDVVYTAPVIQEKISGGSALITGNFTDKEASKLARILKTPFSAPVEIVEQQPVGSSPMIPK
jgi:preprotein translocase subunit SecD